MMQRIFALGRPTPPQETARRLVERSLLQGEAPQKLRAPRVSVLRAGEHWPSRQQGTERGTCTAHAVLAMLEHRLRRHEPASSDLSEQFLFHAMEDIAVREPFQSAVAELRWMSKFSLAWGALRERGVCDEVTCPYQLTPKPLCDPMAGGDPPDANAVDAANRWRDRYAALLATADYGDDPFPGLAAHLIALLTEDRPVAIAVQVFASDGEVATKTNNWVNAETAYYGHVLPTIGRKPMKHFGHAICVVGFEPDDAEPLGGHFIFRNSWGTTWPSQPETHISKPMEPRLPGKGYGSVAASHVEQHCWEWLAF